MASPTIAGLFSQRVVIGVGDMGVSNNPAITLSTYALGSCVAVVAYDPVVKAAGLLHLMLPDSSISPHKAAGQPAMFANTGLPLLTRALAGLRADPARIRILLAGGASVLGTSDTFRIGERNVRATRDGLTALGLGGAIRHTLLGGTVNRTVHLNVGDGSITIKMPDAIESRTLA